jgi:DNA-binding MarR family transcriptional regulator
MPASKRFPEKSSMVARLILLRLTNKRKYVNMADIIPAARRPARNDRPEHDARAEGACEAPAPDDPYWYIEALFFAYRGFTSDPDRILNEIGFGRAHHRVLHFVHRYPGMRVADLLEILQITKQSLARVLRELIKEGYVAQRSGEADRRERLLFVTQEGGALADRLAAPQLLKIGETLGTLGAEGRDGVARFLAGMMAGASRLPAVRQASQPAVRDAGANPVAATAETETVPSAQSRGNKKMQRHGRFGMKP